MIKQSRKNAPAPAAAAVPARGYPRPQLRRQDWISLDGPWQFAIDAEDRVDQPGKVQWSKTIQVPFAPETPASGVHETRPFAACWYRRTFKAPTVGKDQRLILHFGAVDYFASVYVNGHLAVRHEGGYTPFSADITDLLLPGKEQAIVVHAQDDPLDLCKPRGKQDWRDEPHSIWYYRTSGIWQSVWMELVSAVRIGQLNWTPDVPGWKIELRARIDGPMRDGLKLAVVLRHEGRTLADDVYLVERNEVNRSIQLVDPGIDDARNDLLWFPWSPRLIDVGLELTDEDGQVLDSVSSYTAMRSIAASKQQVIFNGRPLALQLVLDQGYWEQSGLTAPDDEALRRDVELAKAMGFNGVRKHQKIEDPRYLYWADRLGLLVWEEMPSAYRFSEITVARQGRQWMEAIERDRSHPCIIAWVPFNESWGVPDLPTVPAQRHAIVALYHLTKSLDPSRLVIGNDGWEAAATDIIGIHDYDPDPQRIERRYAAGQDNITRLFSQERPGHRILLLEGFQYGGEPIMLTEFGGIAYSKDNDGTWGYSRARSPEDLAARYTALLAAVRNLPTLAGFCYTQFADTYQEANGLLTMQREAKFPIEQIRVATRGARDAIEHEMEMRWREESQRATRGEN